MTSNAAQPPVLRPQAVASGMSRAAIFLVVTVNPNAEAYATVRGLCGDLGGLVKAVGFRDTEAGLSCILGIGANLWSQLTGPPMPTHLHPFREFHADDRHAIATPGDLLFHLRAQRMDLCFELATHIVERLGDAVSSADEVHGFRYFDDRDLMGFVDGTENPVGDEAAQATIIGDEDPMFAGGSYVIVQKYLHDMTSWNKLSTEEQENVIGRRKLSDIEMADDVKPSNAHSALTSIEIDGEEVDILRDNMPFGTVSKGEFGTYFIGYARDAGIIELMLENMFVGNPPGNYDRILDFSTAVTGNLFFVPSVPLLESLADDPQAAAEDAPEADPAPPSSGSLNIGSLRGTAAHE